MAITDWKHPTQVRACIDQGLYERLQRLARAADRSLASELRRAVREYVRRHDKGVKS